MILPILGSKKTQMKKLALIFALFSSLAIAGARPGLTEENAKPQAAKTEAPRDAKTLEEEVKVALSDLKKYKHEKSGYSLDYPASWELKDFESPMCFKVFAAGGKINVNSAYEEVPVGTTAQMYADAVKDYMTKKAEYNYKSLSEKSIKVAGVDAIERVQQMGDEEFLGKQLAVYLIKNNKAYTFNGTAEASEYPILEPVFLKMIESISIQ